MISKFGFVLLKLDICLPNSLAGSAGIGKFFHLGHNNLFSTEFKNNLNYFDFLIIKWVCLKKE